MFFHNRIHNLLQDLIPSSELTVSLVNLFKYLVTKYNNLLSFPDYYEKFFKNHNSHAQLEPVTGLLLIYPHNFIHVIEVNILI